MLGRKIQCIFTFNLDLLEERQRGGNRNESVWNIYKADEIIKVKCTKTSDTICEKKPPSPPSPPSPPPRFNIFTIIIVVICIAVLVGLYFAFYKKRI